MKRYILIRIGQCLITILGISIIVFSMTHITGDPVRLMAPQSATEEDIAEIKKNLGLDKPVYQQYWRYVSGAVRGDFGQSIRWNMSVSDLFMDRLPATLQLGTTAMIFAILFGLPIGILSALKVGGIMDRFGKLFALLGQALPSFWVGIMLILIFSVRLKWLPTSGMGNWKNLLMPAFTLGWYTLAAVTRLSRSAMLDVLDNEYIKMARIKGVPEIWVIIKHAFRNAMSTVITLSAIQFVFLISGTMIIEVIFNWPGLGRLMVDAIFARDYLVVQMCLLVSSSLLVFVNLGVDILYAYIDPRIRYN